MQKGGTVYVMSNHTRSTLYIGVTSNLERRVLEHKTGQGSQFTQRYALTDLLYFEHLPDIESAIRREKQWKNWHRAWEFSLIRVQNPLLLDLAADWFAADDLTLARIPKDD